MAVSVVQDAMGEKIRLVFPRAGIVILAAFLLLTLQGAALGQAETAGALTYTVKPGDTLIKICSAFREQTNHYALNDLLNDIRRANNLNSNLLRIGQKLEIPVLAPRPVPRVRHRVKEGAEIRGIYLTGPACGVSTVWQRVDGFVESGGNTVVFDAKDIDGGVSFRSGHPLATWGKGRHAPVISSLPEMMKRFDRRGLYVVARLALFLDGELGRQRPDLALQDAGGQPWTERGCTWIDAGHPEARAYNIALARELAAAGVDEIQFDYVRFPTNGWREDWSGEQTEDLEQVAARRREVISGFLAAARDSLQGMGVKISADLYGIMAWGRMEDLALTGQHVPTIARLVDVICPMIYPSHFGPGFEGRRRPGDDPEYFIGEGTRRFVEQAAGQAEIRPWLQAFAYRVTSYDGRYIERQVVSAREAGGEGWCLWNPSCRYQTALAVMPGLTGQPPMAAAEPAPMLATAPAAAAPEAEPQVAVRPEPPVSPVDKVAAPVKILHRDSPATMLGAMVANQDAKDRRSGQDKAANRQN